jgi:hypothetical protein
MTEPATDFSLTALADADLDVLLAQAGPVLQETLRRYRATGSVTKPSALVAAKWDSFIDPDE